MPDRIRAHLAPLIYDDDELLEELITEFNELVDLFGYDGSLDLDDPQTEEDREFLFAWAEEE